ncbi:MAG: PEPxxWA-CTERM sorting domain-containing protein [Pseudomonadota bacterium]
MKRHALAAGVITALAFASAAHAAVTVTFDELAHTSPVKLYTAPVVSQGFSFTGEASLNSLGVWGTINNADPDGATLVNWNAKQVTVRRTDGGLFSLASLDMTDTYNSSASSKYLFTFFDGSKTTTETVTLDAIRGLQTITFNKDRLEWFSYTMLGNQGSQIDNVVLGDVATVGGVPEPGAWALMILGFGGVGASLRRRSRLAIA